MAFFEVGSRVWVKYNNLWNPALAGSSDGRQTEFKFDNGQSIVMENEHMTPDMVTHMHATSQAGLDDMSLLADLHEGAILYNIALRYRQSKIYTYIGSILAAINPYKKIEGLYGDAIIARYNKKAIGELPPHIYAIANEAYYAMWKNNQNQVALISGESGAGKTESTKFILNYLSYMSNQAHTSKGGRSFEEQIMLTNPILEAFGNAKTVYNNNSSRFGKFVQVNFASNGSIEGGRIIDYLLEKNRVVRQNPNERNFHIFYQFLFSGRGTTVGLSNDPKAYRYTSMSGTWTSEGLDDAKDWDRVAAGFSKMGFTDANQRDVLGIIAAVLVLGNASFSTAGGAQVANMDVVAKASSLLGVEADALKDVLTSQTRQLRGEVISTPLDVDQASDSRDSMCMALYASLFRWIISKLNASLKGEESFHSVGVLDIFGFENFQHNSFEQFNINYANEKLQQYFNRHIFSLEQLEYNREGINWADIDWVDNGECLDLVERKLGLLALIDEESRFPKGTDQTLLTKLHTSHGSDNFYVRPRITNTNFGIRHYAGEVTYDVTGFLEKNRDTFRDDIMDMLQSSTNDFVYDIFEYLASVSGSQANTSRKKPTVAMQFKESLTSLMQRLGAANPFFVRCLKPNMQKVADIFNDEVVLNQLRYSGMMETVRIRRAGYPVRREFSDFLFRYRALGQPASRASLTPPQMCGSILQQFDKSGTNWQLGHTKAFMRESLENTIEKARHAALRKVVMRIRAWIMGYIQRKRYQAMRKSVILLQSWYKMVYYRQIYLKQHAAALRIQTNYRGFVARKLRAKLAEEKRIEEERRREQERLEAIRRQEEIRRLEEAAKAAQEAERIAAVQRLEEAKRAAEEEERRKAEEERRKAEDEVRLREEELAKARVLTEELDRKDREAKRLAEEEAARKVEEERKRKADEEAARAAQVRAKEDEERRRRDAEEAAAAAASEAREEEDEGEEQIEESEHKEGYLGMYRGVLKNLKKRWCILHDDTFMVFKGKQDFLHAGWLTKMGGGTSTFGRQNWKRRWMELRGPELFYMADQSEDTDAKGVVNIQSATEISDTEGALKKDNCFQIITPKRTYYMFADSPEECKEWIDVLNTVKGKTDDELAEMMAQARVNPRHAQVTLELDDVLSVGPTNQSDVEGHPIFVIMSSDRVYKFVAADQDDMDDWVRVLTPKKANRGHGDLNEAEASERGWMLKAGGKGIRRRRWFVLRGDILSYYKQKGDDFTVGSIPLNSLCSVIPPDEATAVQRNDWSFVLHSKHKSFILTCKTQADCNRWINAIQDVIDNSPIIETPTETLIEELKMATPEQVEQVYSTHKVLVYAGEPLRASLLPLPYGDIGAASGSREYGSLQEEALRVSISLLPVTDATKSSLRFGAPDQPVDLIKGVVQVCFDVPKLRNEVYCQVIKLTTNAPNPGSQLNLTHWYLLAALCCSFLPSRKFVRFLRFHLRRSMDQQDKVGIAVARVAGFCLEAIKRTKSRDFPPSTKEIEAIMSGKGLTCNIHCVGGKTIDLPITSSTTCGEVIAFVKKDLNLLESRNGFGLFENCGLVDKYLEEKYTVADILSKWEKYEAHGINPDGGKWRLVFKLFSFYDPYNKGLSKTEKEFLFEQAFENVMNGRFPADDTTHIMLAALRTQYVVGDYEAGAYISDLVKVHPAQQEQLLAADTSSGASGTLKKAATIMKGTLKGFTKNTLRLLKGGTIKKEANVSDAELTKIKADIVNEWKKCKGMTQDMAREGYMAIIQAWDGYGSNIFDVEQSTNKAWPKELWLAISLEGVSIFPRGERERLAFYKYETVLSFGAPVANKYKIMVDNVGSMLFETNMVLEIAKLMKEYIKEIVTRRR